MKKYSKREHVAEEIRNYNGDSGGIIKNNNPYYRDVLLSDYVKFWGQLPSFTGRIELKTDEYYNNGGDENYIKTDVLTIRFGAHGCYYSRNASSPEEITLLNGQTIKDAILRFGRIPDSEFFSDNGKVVSLFLSDGSRYDLRGKKLPWHRFGEFRTDYGDDFDIGSKVVYGKREFMEMVDMGNGFFEAKYSYTEQYCNPYRDYYDDWEEMAEEGAQFSWMDGV